MRLACRSDRSFPRSGLRVCAVLAVLCSVTTRTSAAGPPGYIRFVGENLVATANGEFKDWRIAESKLDEENPGSSFVDVEIQVASLDTGNQKRDDHLRNADFFEVERWPTARVRVHDPKKGAGDAYTATFDVTIRDVKRSLEGSFVVVTRDPPTFDGKLVLDRTDFGVGGPHSALNPLAIKQEIPISFRVTLPSQ